MGIFQSISNAIRSQKYYKKPLEDCLKDSDLAKVTPERHLLNPIMTLDKGKNARLSRNFSSGEFDCHCKYPDCKETLIDRRLVTALEETRREYKRPIRINSAYRCEKHNADVGGHSKSKHKLGLAVDIPTLGTEESKNLLNELLRKYFPFVLIYPPKRNFTHVDFREVPEQE